MEVSIKIMSHSENESTFLLSKEIFEGLMLSEDTMYELHLGNLSEVISVIPSEESSSSLYIQKTMYNRLIPFDNLKLNLWKNNKDLYLGPLVGIFEAPRIISEILSGENRFGEIQQITAALFEGCLCYYFSNENIDWYNEKIKGVTYSPDTDKWVAFWFPMPDVIYDIGIFLSDKLKPLGKETRRLLRKYPNIKFINGRNNLGKWELYEKLSKYPSMKAYLPETLVYTNMEQIKQMLDKYKFIFLKSFNGSMGQEVVSIEKTDECIKINYYDSIENKLNDLFLTSFDDIKAFISNFFGDEQFIIQQGIHLLKFQSRAFDLRVLLNKNEKSLWECTLMICRIAPEDKSITNICSGGTALFYEKAYPILNSADCLIRIPTYDEIFEISKKILGYIQQGFGLFGEIGLDLGLDVHGKIWIIEANAKPDKYLDENFYDLYGNKLVDSVIESYQKRNSLYKIPHCKSHLVYPQALLPFKYAKFLSGYK
jgi:hypothetical protein